jgi:hypothetical protein
MNVSYLASCVIYVSPIVIDCLIARILYFLNDNRLVSYAVHNRRVVDVPNEAPRNEPGENWLLREPAESMEPNAESVEQLESEMKTEIPAEQVSEIEGNRHYSIGHGVLVKGAESPTPTDLENDDPGRCFDIPRRSPTESSSSPGSHASDNVSSSTQIPEPSVKIPDTQPISTPVNDFLSAGDFAQGLSNTTPTSVLTQ